MLTNGMITSAEQVLHHCDNPPCCNPVHLFLGDPAINARDRSAEGRSCAGEWRSAVQKEAFQRLRRDDPGRYEHNWGVRQRGNCNPMAKLSDDDVRLIRTMPGTQREIAAKFGVAQAAISKIRLGKRWKHVV